MYEYLFGLMKNEIEFHLTYDNKWFLSEIRRVVFTLLVSYLFFSIHLHNLEILMMMANLLIPALVTVSEKAGNIARICRQDEHLLSLLVQEKKEGEKNPRFVTDFKTLADVLVQELVKHDLCSKFPSLVGHIYGEETNEFTTDDETIIVEVKSNETETADLLNKVLCDIEASKTLAKVIHSEIDDSFSVDLDVPEFPEQVGIWIDPIDATSEYIRGVQKEENGLVLSGLPCVTVLIGVFDINTGDPIAGVINQPFCSLDESRWTGRHIYGITCSGFKMSEPQFTLNNDKNVAVSSSENEEIKAALTENGYTIIELAGAGYKLMNIITGNVQAYVLSKPTSYLWDICACHAILESINGGIVDFKNFNPIKYKAGKGVDECCNADGIIAYKNNAIKDDLIEILKFDS